MNTRKRVAVIGFDCGVPRLIEKHIEEGHLPHFKKVISNGVIADNCLVPFPTITPPNWATIATGAHLGTHQITDFHVPKPGTNHVQSNAVEAFSSERSKAEFIWDAADKAGKKCIVLNYPGSWPSKMKNGIMVGGQGMTVGEHRDGHQMLESRVSLCANMIISTGIYPRASKGKFEPARDWANLDKPGEDPLEMVVDLTFTDAEDALNPTSWYLLARQTDGDAYDTVTLSPAKDMKAAYCTLKVGEWSHKITANFTLKDGAIREGFFRTKLIELSDDALDCTLFVTSIISMAGLVNPPEVTAKIESPEGAPIFACGMVEYSIGSIDLDTYVEANEIHDIWLGDAACSLMKDGDWDLFYMHSHNIDNAYHVIMNDMEPIFGAPREKRESAWAAHLKIMQSQDKMLGRIIEAAGKGTTIVLVSDHGAVPDGPMFNPTQPLLAAGLTTEPKVDKEKPSFFKDVPFARKLVEACGVPDMAKTKATVQGQCHVYINLKGRDPKGIVEPADYEKVQREIIDALYTWFDPRTGTRPVALALAKKDARILGLYGDACGDVIYAVYPEFSSQHGPILPTAEWGIGALKALFVISGPAIKKGRRLERTIWLEDLVPTICHLADLPVPANVDGATIFQVFKDPNMKLREITKLEKGVARMEAALQRASRQPWDKHDCA